MNTTPEKTRPLTEAIITWDELDKIREMPNLERRIRRDIHDAMLIAHAHLNGNNWPPFGKAPIEKERIRFLIHNHQDLIDQGRPYIECIIVSEN